MATFYCSTKRNVISSETSREVVPVGTNEYILKEQDTPKKPRCDECRYWHQIEQYEPSEHNWPRGVSINQTSQEVVGECRRNPPAYQSLIITSAVFWCGDFQKDTIPWA